MPPLQDEGALYLYLAPFPHESRRLSFEVTGLAAVDEHGAVLTLEVRIARVEGGALQGQRLLATGRLAAGRYTGLRLLVGGARLIGAERPADLLVGPEPITLGVPFEVRRGQALVLGLTSDPDQEFQDGFRFTPRFRIEVPPRTPPELVGACSNARTSDLALLDTRSRAVSAVVATGRGPAGLALDALAARAWVALGDQDQLEVVDLSRAETAGRVQLRVGDRPRSVLLLPDRRTLLVVNAGSMTAAFVDATSGQELGRATVGEDPWSALLLPGGTRAVVVNRRSASLTVLDLATRQAVATLPTDPEPLQAQASQDGSRLYLVHAASLDVVEYALPSLSGSRRLRVGLGASALKLDRRTGLLYVAASGTGRIQVFDPASALPLDGFDVPAGVSQLLIDDVQDQLLALMPSRRAVALVDLTSRQLRAVLDLSADPFECRLAAERR